MPVLDTFTIASQNSRTLYEVIIVDDPYRNTTVNTFPNSFSTNHPRAMCTIQQANTVDYPFSQIHKDLTWHEAIAMYRNRQAQLNNQPNRVGLIKRIFNSIGKLFRK